MLILLTYFSIAACSFSRVKVWLAAPSSPPPPPPHSPASLPKEQRNAL